MTEQAWEQQGADVLLRVRVQPKASRNAWRMAPNGQLKIALTAPPIEGEANNALIVFLAKTLQVPKSRLQLEHGLKSRDKTLRIVDARLNDIQTQFSLYDTKGTQ